jgi:D-glycero-D-manno-heptose 1,7-bisphosphate phosphatase
MRALFLDRDGIINQDFGYVYKIEDFKFCDGIFELLRVFRDRGYIIFIVTNQSGIGRGYYTLEDFNKLTEFMLKEFKKEGIEIASVEFCPHAPEANCSCRKPKTGMIDNILSKYKINLDKSWLIGDKQSDIDLAINAKIANSVAIGSKDIKNSCYNFDTISKCRDFFALNSELL